MKTRFAKFFVIAIVFVLILGACQRSTAPEAPVDVPTSKFSQEMKLAYLQAMKVYEAHVDLDTAQTEKFNQFSALINDTRNQMKDEFAVMDLCYSNTTEFVVASLTGAFGEGGIGGQETQPYLNLLALNQTYNGDVAECQRQATSVLIYTRGKRAEGTNLKNEIFRIRKETTDLELGELSTAVIIDFYNKYGADMQALVQNGDQAFANFVGSQNAKYRLPAKFFGFPTAGLTAVSRDMAICNGYANISNGVTLPPAGTYPYQYGVAIDPVGGFCTLSQKAADGYIVMSISPSLATQQDLQEGCTSFTGDCDEEETK